MRRKRNLNGLYLKVKDWAKSTATIINNQYIELETKNTSFSSMPQTLNGEIHWKFRKEYTQSPPPTFIATIPLGRIFGQNGVVITDEDKLIWEVSIEYGKEPYQHSIFNEKSIPSKIYVDKSIAVLTFCASEYYYHWMFDVLPRIDLLRRNNINIDLMIVNRKGRSNFQTETLKKLGINEEQLIECESTTHLQARELIVPSSVGYTGHMPEWACSFLRKTFLDSFTTNVGAERIYISRENANSRKVLNENEVMEKLNQYGFKRIVLEGMSFEEQIKIFSSAKVIVAPHGGGLTNLVFCNPGTKIVELFSPNYVNVLYWVLCNHVKHDYYYLIGKGEHPPEFVDPHIVWDDITIDINELDKLLKMASIS